MHRTQTTQTVSISKTMYFSFTVQSETVFRAVLPSVAKVMGAFSKISLDEVIKTNIMLRKQGRAHLPHRLVEAAICLEGGHDSITEAWKIAHDSNRTPGHELRQTCTNCFSISCHKVILSLKME